MNRVGHGERGAARKRRRHGGTKVSLKFDLDHWTLTRLPFGAYQERSSNTSKTPARLQRGSSTNPTTARRSRPESSLFDRDIPLIGISLEAMRQFSDGFPHYGDTLSAAVNAYFSDHGLRETEGHTLYSLRHGLR